MSGSLAEMKTRFAALESGRPWRVAKFEDFRQSHGFQQITRELVGVPVELLQAAIESLKAAGTLTGIVVAGKAVEGSWRQSAAWWEERGEREDSLGRPPAAPGQSCLVLVQVLTDLPTTGEAVVVEKGCAYKVTQTFYWQVGALPEVTQSTSGVAYSLDGISRSRDTGLYSCVLTKRERQTQTVPIYTAEQTVFEKDEKQQFIGVVDGSTPAGILTPVAPSGGVIVSQEISKNEDCTTNVAQRKATELPVSDAAKSGTKTIFETVAEDLDKNQAADTDLTVPDASGGVVTTKEGTKTPGGLLDVRTRTVTEVGVTDTRHETAKTLFEAGHQATDRSQTTAADDAAAASGGVIETVTAEKTAGGKFDNTKRTVTEQAVADAVKANRVQASETESVTVARGQAADTDLTASLDGTTHVITEKRGEKTPGGLLDVTTTTRTPTAWTETFTVTTRGGTTKVTLFRNKTADEVDTLIAALDSDASNSASAGRNEYGLYDGTLQSFIPEDAGVWTWDRQNLTKVVSGERYDAGKAEQWYWQDTYTYQVRSGIGVSAGHNHFKGGHSSGTFTSNEARDTYLFLRVTKIERQYYKIGTTSSGTWTPGNTASQGSSITLFTAAATPWGTS